MNRIMMLVMGLSFSIGTAIAGPIPDPYSPELQDQLAIPADKGEALGMLDLPARPATVENLRAASSLLYFQAVEGRFPGKTDALPEQAEPAAEAPSPVVRGTKAVAATVTTVNSDSDSYYTDTFNDGEPTVISIPKNGSTYTTSARIKFLSDGTYRLYYSTNIAPTGGVFGSLFFRGALPMPSGWNFSADPYLAENPHTSGIGAGNIYLVGLLQDINTSTETFNRQAIGVWRSTNGGLSWTGPTIVAQAPGQSVDKPHISVSWHAGTLGTVYVSYTHFANPTRLYVARSTDGGVTFSSPVLVSSGGTISGTQILVSPNAGYLYLLWTNFDANAIMMSQSTNLGATWSAPETAAVATGQMYLGEINGHLRLPSFPIARFNWVANRIGVVWHERDPNSGTTDVYYTAKSPWGWQSKVKINDAHWTDQFLPALDFDTAGNFLVTFYDRRDDPANLNFHLYGVKLNPNGTALSPNFRISSCASALPVFYRNRPFIGDYHEVWFDSYPAGDRMVSAWVGHPVCNSPSYNDVYFSAIQP